MSWDVFSLCGLHLFLLIVVFAENLCRVVTACMSLPFIYWYTSSIVQQSQSFAVLCVDICTHICTFMYMCKNQPTRLSRTEDAVQWRLITYQASCKHTKKLEIQHVLVLACSCTFSFTFAWSSTGHESPWDSIFSNMPFLSYDTFEYTYALLCMSCASAWSNYIHRCAHTWRLTYTSTSVGYTYCSNVK